MEETVIVIMERDAKTGFLEKELLSFTVSENDDFLVNIYAQENEIYMKISTAEDVMDWQFNAIYDYYDTEPMENLGIKIIEDAECYNPTWTVVFKQCESLNELPDKISDILAVHKAELESVFDAIKDKKEEYGQ